MRFDSSERNRQRTFPLKGSVLVTYRVIIRREMHLCKRWVWENAYSSLKSVERPINLYIILFDNHSPFQKSVFGHSKDVLDKYVQKYEKYFLQKKNVFLP